MSKGAGIKALRIETLNRVIKSIPKPQKHFFSNMFGTSQEESDTIRWLLENGSIGMTPFVAPGSPAPVTTDDTFWGEGSARAAYYKEKRFFDEVFLNNMGQPELDLKYINAEKRLAKTLGRLKFRCERRREWMIAQMMVNGKLSYNSAKGIKFTVDYQIPSAHKIVLTGNDVWGTGTTRNPVRDMFDIKKIFTDDVFEMPKYVLMNTNTLQLLLFDSTIQDLLKKSAFGQGDLFASPAKVIGSLLGIGDITLYDDIYDVRSHIVTNVNAGANTVTLDDVTDMEIGGTARLINMSAMNTYEDIAITGINYATNVITLGANVVGNYRGGRDIFQMRKKFVADDTIMMFTDEFEGEKVAEIIEAPFGLDRTWGMFTDTKPEWDPDGIWVRVQDKALPVMYNPNTIVTLKVK